ALAEFRRASTDLPHELFDPSPERRIDRPSQTELPSSAPDEEAATPSPSGDASPREKAGG
ncbi:MAG: hypothetical protein JSU66_17070, partial [Deltaproteobacteria bacterium]